MAVLKCKMCGGSLNVEAGMTVVECEYCGSKQTVPSVDDEKKLKLYERAGKLLRNCEFDKAAGVFESIVAEYSEESEAYWGLVLCAYGIEYVDDPATGKKIPTCHRSSFESVMDDSNFEQALENADATARAIYREEAKTIEELRKGIIEVSSKEEPYDIFICYKETAANGDRTIDSVIAQDVYDALTDKGYRVFFSRITLEDKLGQEYEPYIFAALNSAKVMLAFGTDYEYYNTVWVKNEWSRFLQLMTKDKTKHLIPCYKGIDAYDMPKEFAKLQAQDMGKVGAVQDLLRGIEKLLPRETQKEVVKETVVVGAAANTVPLLKRAFMFLEDEKWDKADEFCEQVLNIDPECAEAYLGKLMAELQVPHREKLANCNNIFEQSDNYQKSVRFGNENLKNELEGYLKAVIVDLQKQAEQKRAEQERKAEEVRAVGEKRKKKAKRIFAFVVPLVLCITIWVVYSSATQNEKYSKGIYLRDSRDYDEAIEVFASLGDYKDAKEQLAATCYAQAKHLFFWQDYEKAIECLALAGNYKDSHELMQECYHLHGYTLCEKGDYIGAVDAFKSAGNYGDSRNCLNMCQDLIENPPSLSNLQGKWRSTNGRQIIIEEERFARGDRFYGTITISGNTLLIRSDSSPNIERIVVSVSGNTLTIYNDDSVLINISGEQYIRQ